MQVGLLHTLLYIYLRHLFIDFKKQWLVYDKAVIFKIISFWYQRPSS